MPLSRRRARRRLLARGAGLKAHHGSRDAGNGWRPHTRSRTTRASLGPAVVLGDDTVLEGPLSHASAGLELPGRLVVRPPLSGGAVLAVLVVHGLARALRR